MTHDDQNDSGTEPTRPKKPSYTALETRVAELASFAFYVLDHSNDPAIVANAKRVLGK